MSYAKAFLDLTSINVACLTGQNGSGKTALLDAITWTLWDKARASSDELIRLGQNEMWVELTFSIKDQLYRVRRMRQKSGKSRLDFQLFAGNEEEKKSYSKNYSNNFYKSNAIDKADVSTFWRSLNASSIKETQEKLKEILCMDFDTFISSVYLRQGRADEFSIRSAGERKQVLSEILGLTYFDKLQDLAREETKICKGKAQILALSIDAASGLEHGFSQSLESLQEIEAKLLPLASLIEDKASKRLELEIDINTLNNYAANLELGIKRKSDLTLSVNNFLLRKTELEVQIQQTKMLLSNEKDILAQVSEFDGLKIVAEKLDNELTLVSELTSKKIDLKSFLALMQGRLEVELEHLTQLVNSRIERKIKLEKELKDKDKLLASYATYKNDLQIELEMSSKREKYLLLYKRIEELQLAVNESRIRLETEIQQKISTYDELENLLNNKLDLLKEQDILKSEVSKLDLLEVQFESVEENGLKIKSEIESLEQNQIQLRKQIKENDFKVKEILANPNLSNCPLCRASIVDAQAVLDSYSSENQNCEHEITSLEHKKNKLIEKRQELRKEYVNLRAKLDERKLLDRKIGEFNEKSSALERAELTCSELKNEIETMKERLKSKSYAIIENESLIRIKSEISKLDFDPIVFANLQAQIRAQRYLEAKYQQYLRDNREYEEILEELPALNTRIICIESDLKEKSFAPTEQLEIKHLEEQIAALSYDKNKHNEVKSRLVQLLPSVQKAYEINKAKELFPDLENALGKTLSDLQVLEIELQDLDTNCNYWSEVLESKQNTEAELELLKGEITSLENSRQELNSEKLVLESKIERLAQDKKELDDKRESLSRTMVEMEEYTQLAEAFGKKGIQAVIIENSLPELEIETNYILSQLTDNQMHVGLLTQQKNKQGNLVETLEILISDDQGTRNYELYSGGEAFKINFALRVALSKLLARRSGARLETLIIDEGFGSQDELSRTKLIQSIRSIAKDFARIIVVTHIAEVKEMFPVQISVSKESGISQVSVHS